jgi:hypothetical protein
MAGWVGVTNIGTSPCVLSGSPRRIQLRSGTTVLAPVTYRAEPGSGPGNPAGSAGPVLLHPGDQAGAFVEWTNWCPPMIPVVTSLLVTLPAGGRPLVAGPESPGPGLGSTPRCDDAAAATTVTAFAFVAVPPSEPPYEPEAAQVSLSVPPTVKAGTDLDFLVTLANRGSKPASLDPCPTYSEDLIVGGRRLKPPANQQFLLNCSVIGDAIAPGSILTLQMHYAVPAALARGPVELVWGMDPGGPFDASTALQRASLVVTGP